MAKPFKKIAQFFKRVAPVILAATGHPGAAAVVKAAENAPQDAPDLVPAPKKQVAQGGLTYTSIAVMLVAATLEKYGVVPDGFDSVTTATFVVAFGGAIYGRLRREWRDGS